MMEVTALCQKFTQKFHTTVATAVQMRPVDFLLQEGAFAVDGHRVTLKEFETKAKAKAQTAERKARSKSPQVREVKPARPERKPPQLEQNEELYQELHAKIASRNFTSRVAQALTTIKEAVEEKSVLNIQEVAKGGSIGKGTAIVGAEDAELVFFVQGLPTEGYSKWLAPLLKMLKGTLQVCIP